MYIDTQYIDSCLEDQHTQLEPITNYTLLRKTQQQHLTNELAPFRTLPISHFSPSYQTRNIWLPNDESWCSSILMTSYHKGEETRHIFHSYSMKHGLTGLSISKTNLTYHLLSAGSAPTQNLPYTFLLHFSSHVTQLHHLFLLLTKWLRCNQKLGVPLKKRGDVANRMEEAGFNYTGKG